MVARRAIEADDSSRLTLGACRLWSGTTLGSSLTTAAPQDGECFGGS